MKKLTEEDKKEILKDYFSEVEEQIQKLPNLYSFWNENRMMAYLWYENDDIIVNENGKIEGECKFGEHFLVSNHNAFKTISNYVRSSLSRRKDKWDDGSIKLLWIWDITEYSKKYNRFRMHSHVDDHIREKIGFVKQSEVHSLDPLTMLRKVNEILAKEGQTLPTVDLKTAQMRALITACSLFLDKKSKVILADLYARFGKTIWSLGVATELDWNIIVIASYVKTSFVSFRNDGTSFQQFKDIVHIDSSDSEYKKLVLNALKEGKRIIVYVSLCKGSKRDSKINFLLSKNVPTGLIVDEADFGAQRKGQATPLINASKKNEHVKVILMTGTNADRAAKEWKIDDFISETYYESLVDKYEAEKKHIIC